MRSEQQHNVKNILGEDLRIQNVLISLSSPGGAGVHVQSDRGNRSLDDAQSLRYSRLGGQLIAHLLFRIHEVCVDLPQPLHLLSVSVSQQRRSLPTSAVKLVELSRGCYSQSDKQNVTQSTLHTTN